MQEHSMSPSNMWCHHRHLQDVEVQFALKQNRHFFRFFFHFCFWTNNSLTFNCYFYTMVYLFIFYSNTIARKKQHFTPLCILLIFRIACKGACNFFRIGVHNPDKRPFGRILSICETLKCLCGSQRCHQSQRWGHVEWLNLERGETMQRRVGMLSANDHGAC